MIVAAGIALTTGAGYLAGDTSRSIAITTALIPFALGLIGLVLHSVRREVAAEQPPAGRRYDAVHAGVSVRAVHRAASGSTQVELTYRSRQIVYLDDDGFPTSAELTGPGSVQVLTGPVHGRWWRRHVRTGAHPLAAPAQPLVVTERGVRTGDGRLVTECVLSGTDGTPVLTADMLASTSFPTS